MRCDHKCCWPTYKAHTLAPLDVPGHVFEDLLVLKSHDDLRPAVSL